METVYTRKMTRSLRVVNLFAWLFDGQYGGRLSLVSFYEILPQMNEFATESRHTDISKCSQSLKHLQYQRVKGLTTPRKCHVLGDISPLASALRTSKRFASRADTARCMRVLSIKVTGYLKVIAVAYNDRICTLD